MSFIKLIIKNPFRNKTRAILSIFGIAIAISLIIALGSISDGMVDSVEKTLNTGNSDFMLMNKNSTSNLIDNELINQIKNISGVEQVIGIYESKIPIEENRNLYLYGINEANLKDLNIKIIEGDNFNSSSNEIIIGKMLLNENNLKIGNNLKINGVDYKITGAFETGTLLDSYAFTSLKHFENITGSKENNATILFIKTSNIYDVENVSNEIKEKYGNIINVVLSIEDISSINSIYTMLSGVKWGVTFLALLVGGISIINTMLSTVYERTKEIGVLKAVGWSNRRILSMIVGESIVLTLIGGFLGYVFGIILVESLYGLGILQDMIPKYTVETFILAIITALLVGIIGGLFPAIKATKVPVTESLRHE